MSVPRAALHFLLLGGALYALRAAWSPEAPPKPAIVLTADDTAALAQTWAAAHGMAPGPTTQHALVASAIDEEVLHRDALALGLDRADGAVRERLVRLGSFLGEDAGDGEDAARTIGLTRADVVIHRHLVEMMHLAAGRVAPTELPDERALQSYLDRHADRFTVPERLRLTHVYLSHTQRGAHLEDDARRLAATLRRTGPEPASAAALGDAFIHGADVGPATLADLARLFGPALPAALTDAPVRTWIGPLPSSYGLHVVWVHERTPAGVPPLAAVRSQVLHTWLRERGEEQRQARMAALRGRYDVRVE